MRYEDASHTGAFTQGSEPDARNDADAIAAGAQGPATGNVITGAGTQTGPSGSDYGPGAHITSIAGAGGEDSSFAGGKLGVSGEFGRLSIDADGNYSYQPKANTPENSVDRFTYTLADAQGNADTATLTVEIGKTPAVIKANAQQVVPGPDGVVILPPGVELSDVHIVGRNLVIDLPDGSQMVIIDGAVFVPQLVLGGVEVPATNLAALLVGQEIAPAAGDGPPQSSGGNFDVPVPPLDPGIPLGDLIPPTEYNYVPPEVKEVFDVVDEEPEIFIQPDGQPAAVNAVDSVDEKGLPGRNEGEPEGSGEEAAAGADGDPSEATGGTIVIDSPDGIDSLTITGSDGIPHEIQVGLIVQGAYGTLTITGIVGGNFTYSYVLNDNIDHSDGAPDHDDFSVTLTDNDGDQATATLVIDIIDDVPTARPDTDFIAVGEYGPVTGNVITDDSAGDLDDSGTDRDTDNGRDTVGADDASLTAITGFGATTPTEGGFTVIGHYGVLTIDSDGSYSYTRNPGTPGGVNDVFNYTLTDGDGDTSTTTLTITIDDAHITVGENPDVLTDDDAVPLAGGNDGGPGDDVDADNLTGTLSGSGGDGPLTFDLQTTGAPAGFTYVDGPDGSILVKQVQGGVNVTVLTITVDAATGAYEVTQNAPILHDPSNPGAGEGEADNFENNASFTINYTVSDQDDDVGHGTLTINVDDDTPEVTENQLGGTVDEDGLAGGNVGGDNDVPGADVVATGDVSELFSPGADQPLTFSLNEDTSGLRQDLTSKGVPITYDVDGDTLTAMAGDRPVFTFVLDAETGEYTFTLLDQLDHPSLDGETGDDTENPTDQDLTIPLGSIIQATDADGDSVTAPGNGLIITVDDDSPLPFEDCPDDVISVNDPGADPFTGSLNLPPVGADEPGVVTFGVTDGQAVLDTEGHPVTSGEDALFYFINDAGVLEARVGDETGELIFTITLNGDGTFTYDQIGTIGIGGTISFSDFDQADAGNTNYLGLGNDDAGSPVDLLMSAGENTDADADIEDTTVNTDSDSIGAQNQSMDANDSEVLRLDFVSNLQSGAATPTGFSFDGHVPTNSYLQLIPQVQGSQDALAAFKVWALDSTLTDAGAPDRNPADGFSDATPVTITEVTIIDYETGETHVEDISGLANGATEVLDFGVSVTRNADGSVTFSGIQEGDQYGVATGGNNFNAIAVQATDHSFDLGVFSIGVANEFEPVDLSVPIALTDSDGDSVVCDIDIHIGEPLAANDVVVTVNEAGLPLIGSDEASNSETRGGNLQDQVSGGSGPFSFAFAPGESGDGTYGTLTLNPDGTFSYTLETPFDSQPDADDGTNPELGAESFEVVATDSEGATQTITVTVNIIDDVPSIDVTAGDDSEVELVTHDALTIGGLTDHASSTADFSGVFGFTAVAGADGATVTPDLDYELGISAPGVDSQLNQGGANIYLHLIGGKVVGSTSSDPNLVNAGNTVFDVTVSATGVVTLNQYSQIDHPLQGGLNDTPFDDQIIALADGLVTLTASASIIDNDGDTDADSETIGIGTNLQFADHGPIANNDVDALAPGNVGIADGNVLTGVGGSDTFGPDGVADTIGADTPGTVTGISSNNTANSDIIADGSGNFVVNGQFGQLTINANGAYSYDRFDDSPGGTPDVFTYTLTDADGDTDTATLTINIGVNPPVSVNATAKVDDDGLAGANPAGADDINANDGTETGAGVGNEKIYTGSLATSVSGGDGDVDFRLVEPADGASIGQETVNYSMTDIAGVQTLTATIATSPGAGRVGTVLFTVVLDKESGAYTVDLKDNVLHGDDANNNEDGIEVTAAIGYIATDAGATDSNQSTLTIQFNDDVPTANDDGPVIQATENVAFTIDALANDVFGADGVDISSATKVVITSNATQGVVTYDTTTHLFTYTPNADAGSTGTSDSFTYKIIDADGDEDSATVNITLQPDSTPQVVNVVAAVDDDGLLGSPAGVLEAGNGDINANTGEPGATASEAVYTGQLTVNFGADTGTVDFSNLNGTFGQVGTERVQYSWDAGTHVLTATVTHFAADLSTVQPREGTPLFQVNLSASGAYTVTLLDNVLHATGGNNENSAPVVDLNYRAIESGGFDSVTTGKLSITFNDDMPTAVHAAGITSGLQNGGGDSASANLDAGAGGNSIVADNFGADGGKVIFNAASQTYLQGLHLKHAGVELTYVISPDGQSITGSAGATPIITIALQTGGGNDYTVTMHDSIDTLVTTVFDDLNFDFVGGNGSWAGFTSGTNGDNINDLLLTPMVNGANSSTMNTNANEGGVGSGNSVSLGEGVRIDSVSDLQAVPAPTPSGDYGTGANQNHVFGQHENVVGLSGLLSTVNGPPGSTTEVQLTARDESGASDLNDLVGDGTIEPITVVTVTHGGLTGTVLRTNGASQDVIVDGITYHVTFQTNTATVTGVVEDTRIGAQTADGYDSLEFRNVGGQEFKIGAFAALDSSAGPVDLAVPISVVDADGDTVGSGTLPIHIDGSNEAAALTTLSTFAAPAEDTSSFSSLLASDSQQVEKTAANSNTTLLAAAVAASGLASTQAAASSGDSGDHGHQASFDTSSFAAKFADLAVESGEESRFALSNEAKVAVNDDAEIASSSHGNSDSASSQGLDNAAAHMPAELSAFFAAVDQGPAADAAAAGPVAPAVAMVSAEALQAAGLDGTAKHGGEVDKVLADALGHGAPPTVDGLLQAIGGAHGPSELAAISHVASPAADAVPAWDTGSAGAFVPGADMMFKMGAEMLHHDAVQPVVNG